MPRGKLNVYIEYILGTEMAARRGGTGEPKEIQAEAPQAPRYARPLIGSSARAIQPVPVGCRFDMPGGRTPCRLAFACATARALGLIGCHRPCATAGYGAVHKSPL